MSNEGCLRAVSAVGLPGTISGTTALHPMMGVADGCALSFAMSVRSALANVERYEFVRRRAEEVSP
jgi:hypothetical protein